MSFGRRLDRRNKDTLKSKEKGLELSDTHGSRFSGNGDALGFSYNSDDVLHSVGKKTGIYDEVKDDSSGPCIASVIDLRSLPGTPVGEDMVIENGTAPGAAKSILRLVLGIASEVLGEDTFLPFEKLEKLLEVWIFFFSLYAGWCHWRTRGYCPSLEHASSLLRVDSFFS